MGSSCIGLDGQGKQRKEKKRGKKKKERKGTVRCVKTKVESEGVGRGGYALNTLYKILKEL